MLKTNDAGIEIIKFYEGLKDGDPDTPGLDPYICPAGHPTIGWGSTWGFDGKRITMGHRPITVEEAVLLLKQELARAEKAVSRLVKVALTENQFSALVSFVYNVGSGNFAASTMRSKLNRGDYDGAANEFWKWRRSNGVILGGLVKRRAAEKALFIS